MFKLVRVRGKMRKKKKTRMNCSRVKLMSLRKLWAITFELFRLPNDLRYL